MKFFDYFFLSLAFFAGAWISHAVPAFWPTVQRTVVKASTAVWAFITSFFKSSKTKTEI